jgi:hypothetical protein
MTVAYEHVVFMQGDDADEPLDVLYSREADDSVVYHGPTAESAEAAFAYLSQWDYGDPAERYGDPASGSGDNVFVSACGGYRISASLRYRYIGLERIVALPVESYRCPCCGVDVMDSRPVWGDCRTAGCEPSVDACGDLGYRSCHRANEYADGAK